MSAKLIKITDENYKILDGMKDGKLRTMNSVVSFLIENLKSKKRAKPKKDSKPKVEADLNLPEVVNKKEPSKSWQVWEAYRDAYKLRYDSEPIHNAKQMAHCKQLISRLGLNLAIEVTRFYLTVNDQWQLRRSHDLGSLVKDCESFVRRMERDIRTISLDRTRQVERLSEWDQFRRKIQEQG